MRAALGRRLPPPLRRIGSRVLDAADPLHVAALRARGRVGGPLPPRRLRGRVGEPDPVAYAESGAAVAGEIRSVLEAVAAPLEGAGSIWDLGAGSGRVLARLGTRPRVRVVATDVDAEACEWARAELGLDARTSDYLPPAPLGEERFALVLAISVFTHLDEPEQDLWLEEIARRLEPGGTALLTVMGPTLRDAYVLGRRPGMDEEQRILLSADGAASGFTFAPEAASRTDRRRHLGVPPRYGLAFHEHEYVREHWGRFVAVREIVPAALNWRQDAVICTRLDE